MRWQHLTQSPYHLRQIIFRYSNITMSHSIIIEHHLRFKGDMVERSTNLGVEDLAKHQESQKVDCSANDCQSRY